MVVHCLHNLNIKTKCRKAHELPSCYQFVTHLIWHPLPRKEFNKTKYPYRFEHHENVRRKIRVPTLFLVSANSNLPSLEHSSVKARNCTQ